MESEWEVTDLGSLVSIKGGKRLPKGEALLDQPNEHPYIRVRDITDGGINKDALLFVPKNIFKKISRYTVDEGDIIITIVGTVGLVAEVPASLHKASLTENAAKLIVSDHEKLYAGYLKWFLSSPQGQHEIAINTVGSTQPKLPIYGIANIITPLPPLPEQKAIAHILGSLDDKIELNRRMNATLEGMAQALFRSWFVDFDPVIDNALAAGNPLPDELAERAEIRSQALADGTANRQVAQAFPAAFQFSEELGWIPEGWEATPFRSFTIAKTDRVGEQDVPEYSSTNEGLVPRSDRFNKQLSKSKSNNKLIQYGDLVFGMSRQILNFGLMHQEVGSVSSAYNVFEIDQSRIFPEFVESYIRARPNYYFGILGSSSREGQSLSKSNFNSTLMLIPPSKIQTEFQRLMMGFVSKQMSNTSQSDCLAALRDTLLPKLISGDLRIPDGAALAEEALA